MGVSGFVWGLPACPGKSLGLLPELERLTSLKQHPSQGLLIPRPATDHVNPDLSDQAACPGAASPLACRRVGVTPS